MPNAAQEIRHSHGSAGNQSRVAYKQTKKKIKGALLHTSALDNTKSARAHITCRCFALARSGIGWAVLSEITCPLGIAENN